MRHEIVPIVADQLVAIISGVQAIASHLLHGEASEIDGEDVFALVETLLDDAGDKGLVLDGVELLVRFAGADDDGDEDGGVGALLDDFVDEFAETAGSGGWVVALLGDGGAWVHVIGASVEEDNVGALVERWVDVLRHELDCLAVPCSLLLPS